VAYCVAPRSNACATISDVEKPMFISFSCRLQLVTMVALVLSARADPISSLRPDWHHAPMKVQHLPSAKIVSVELLYKSALVRNEPKLTLPTYLIQHGDTALSGAGASRGTSVLDWVLRILGQLVLPDPGRHPPRK